MKRIAQTLLRIGNLKVMTVSVLMTTLSSCIIVNEPDYGPPGQPGKAYFGIDYDHEPPYSYWDDNPSIPDYPFFGDYYQTHSGHYNFEYFINKYDYWYGYYEVDINPGHPGQLYDTPGANGANTYLMLICNYDGFYFEFHEDCDCYRKLEDGTHIIEFNDGARNFKIQMKKANVMDRPTENIPKFKR